MSLWIISHTRESPAVLRELERPDDHAPQVLRTILERHLLAGHRILPDVITADIGERYEVLDDEGWLATYWLSERQVLPEDGAPTG